VAGRERTLRARLRSRNGRGGGEAWAFLAWKGVGLSRAAGRA
jgi:hypothetical protein